MKLNKDIANMIVKRTMQIIPNSVNVMDENGIIIASGDPKRLNQKHTGAVVTLRKNQIVEIDHELAKLWNYEAKEGINLPLSYLGSNVGVIGISGNPNEVRQYAQLVKMAAELIMEQSFLLEQERWQRRYKEEFIRELLKGDLNQIEISEQAQFFDIPFHQSFSVILLKVQDPTADKLQTLLAYIEHHYPKLPTAVIGRDRIALLKSSADTPIQHKKEIIDFSHPEIQFKAIVGLQVNDLSQTHISYQTACYAAEYTEKTQSKKHVIQFDQVKLPALFQNFSHTWQADILLSSFKKLLEQDEQQILIKTLQIYFVSNCDLSHTSQKLFIHPNTLRYRLMKIEQITSLSFNKIDEKFILYLGTIIYLGL
ncbi:CdaR family transcriptional regulator [Glaesserella sp.]|uniref:CdaR family transcriptional regulator n=1 Tax=Glaesserella sp. TaxID=2094731 RepID=UPI00359FAC29